MDIINYQILYNGFKHVNNYLSFGKGISVVKCYFKADRELPMNEVKSILKDNNVEYSLIIPPNSKYIVNKFA